MRGDNSFYLPIQRRIAGLAEAQTAIAVSGIGITGLSPQEVVALYRLTDDEVVRTEAGAAWRYDSIGLHARLQCTLANIAIVDPERAKVIFSVFADSPLAEDRKKLAEEFLAVFTKYHEPDAGIVLWDRLIRDANQAVRDAAEQHLKNILANFRRDRRRRPAHGMYAIDSVNEAKLLEDASLTREDVYKLMESYAYAENGHQVHDLGLIALRRLTLSEQPEP